MFGRFDESKRSPPRFTTTPMFDNNSLPLPFPRWSNAPAERELLSRASFSLNGPMPLPKPIPISRKYSHVQSKVAQLWQDQQTLPPRRWQSSTMSTPDEYEKPVKISSKTKREMKEVELSRVREDVVQLAIGLHIRRLSHGIILQSGNEEEENLFGKSVRCELFGIKDYLSAPGSEDIVDDMGKALETRPPDILDCHMSDMVPCHTPPPLDNIRTPTPASDVDVDGFPDECGDTDDFDSETKRYEIKKDTNTSIESERSESEASLNFTNASVDSIAESELIAEEPLEVDSNSSLIDNAGKC
uniref:Uncharacterized protein n=1 Tax=Strigamia maritima TaxID=126957 RepID=T1JKA7_STRMM